MHFKNKKGFTVVELIIVLAIIGILAAVLIPTFASIIRTAQVNSDNQLIRNLNTALAADHKSHPTLHDALKAAFDFGYDVSKINASCVGNEILYDSVNEVFCYFDSRDGGSVSYIPESQHEIELDTTSCAYWRIINEKNVSTAFTAPDENGKSTLSCGTDGMGWSCYLVTVPDGVTEIETNAGVDTGDTDSIVKVAFKNSGAPGAGYTNTSAYVPPVVIRTTDGLLEIDAPKFTVHHYGVAIFLDIIAVGTASYHEFGYVLQAQIRTGRVVNEAGTVTLADGTTVPAGIVNLFLICNHDERSFAEIIVAAAVGALLPTLDRTAVNIPEGGMLVLKVEEDVVTTGSGYTAGNYDYIYLYKSGVEEQIVTSKTKVPDGTLLGKISGTDPITSSDDANATFVKGTDSIANSDSKTAAIQIANVPTAGGYDVDAPNIDVYPKDTYASIANTYGSNALFAGGTGTVNNPYLISKGSQFKNITGALTDKHYRIVANIPIVEADFSNTTDSNGTSYYLIEELSGSLDGAGHRLTLPAVGSNLYVIVYELGGTFKNIDIELNTHGTIAYYTTSPTALFENVDVYGDISCNTNYGAYVMESTGATFSDCDFFGMIHSIGGSEKNNNAIYVGLVTYNSALNGEQHFTFRNCHNYGTLISGDAAMFIGNNNKLDTNNWSNAYIYLTIENCTNEGEIQWMESTGYRAYNHFVASNVQTLKEIIIDGNIYVRDQSQADESTSDNIFLIEQVYDSANKKISIHSSPVMPDANGRNYILDIPDSTLAIYENSNGTFTVIPASVSGVSYYVVTDKTYGYYNGSSKIYTISEQFTVDQFVAGKYTTTMKNLAFIDDHWIEDNSAGEESNITINGKEYPIRTVGKVEKYYYHDGNYVLGTTLYRNKPGSVSVSAFNANGAIVASAKLSDAPESELTATPPAWFVEFDQATMTNVVEIGLNGANVTNTNNLYNAENNKARWKQSAYTSTTAGGYGTYESSGKSTDYATGFIKMSSASSVSTKYILKTKVSSFTDDHNRIAIAFNGNAFGITDNTSKVRAFTVGGSGNGTIVKLNSVQINRYKEGDWYYYELDLESIYSSNMKKNVNDPESLASAGVDLYFKISIVGSDAGESIIYAIN